MRAGPGQLKFQAKIFLPKVSSMKVDQHSKFRMHLIFRQNSQAKSRHSDEKVDKFARKIFYK